MKKIHQDVWCGAALLALAGFAVMNSYELGKLSFNSVVLPWIACAIIAVFGVLILVDGVRKTKNAAAKGELPKQHFTAKDMKVPMTAFGIIAAYIAAFWCVGYMVATPVFMLGFMRYLKMKDWKVMAIITAIFMVIVYGFFVLVLNVRLDNFGAISTYLLK